MITSAIPAWARLGLVALLLIGCKSKEPAKCLEHHMVLSDRAGTPIHPRSRKVLADPKKAFETILTRADKICEDRWKTAEKAALRVGCQPPARTDRLLIHIHGGLNSLSKAQSTTAAAVGRMDELFRQRLEDLRAQPETPTEFAVAQAAFDLAYEEWHYPIFLAWPSDALSTVSDSVFNIRQGHRWRILGPITSPFALAADLGRAVASAPINVPYTLLSDAGLGLNVATGRHPGPSWHRAADVLREAHARGYRVSLGSYSRGYFHQAKRMVSYLVTLPFKVGTQVVALEGLGRGAWDVMQRRANCTVYSEEEFEGSLAVGAKGHFDNPARGAFGQFFHCLVKRSQQAGPTLELTFAAHSTGAVPFNHLLLYHKNSEESKLPIKRVIYMAPACSGRDAVEALSTALRRNKDMEFYLLTLHPQADADEAQWQVLDCVPRGSLLEWIDNFFSDPTDHGDRVFGKWVNAIQLIHLFEEFKTRVSFKAFPVDGSDVPTRHGGFNTRNFWTESFRTTDAPKQP